MVISRMVATAMDDQVFRRVKSAQLKEHKHARVSLIGRVEACASDKMLIDCGDGKVQVSANSQDTQLAEVKPSDFVEVRGEPISENFLIMSDFSKIANDFDLTLYNKTLDMLAAKASVYA